ncbi:MafI family immunity protein [Microbispora sp. NPDC004025]
MPGLYRSHDDYADLRAFENRLRSLLEGLKDRLTAQSLGDAQEFLAAGEYGLALETAADWLSEEGFPLSGPEKAEFAALAADMSPETMARITRALGS